MTNFFCKRQHTVSAS